MINYNVINEDLVQIYGSEEKVHINGIAHKIDSCFYFNITLLRHPIQEKISNSQMDCTITNLKNLTERINKIVREFINEN